MTSPGFVMIKDLIYNLNQAVSYRFSVIKGIPRVRIEFSDKTWVAFFADTETRVETFNRVADWVGFPRIKEVADE